MKKRRKESIFLICVIAVILACGMLFYYQKKNNKCVDLTGTDNKWKVSLNINFAYNSIIVIRPYADYYNNSSQVPPSIIHVRILDGEKEVYDKNLSYIQEQKDELGYYSDDFLSNFKFPSNIEQVTMIIEYDGEEHSILLSL